LLHRIHDCCNFPLRYLSNTPSLTVFRKSGLEQFIANVGVLSDGRVICVSPSPLRLANFKITPLVWGSKFGACFRLGLSTEKAPAQAVLVPGESVFEALKSGQFFFISYRLGRIHTIHQMDISSSAEAFSIFTQLIAMCLDTHSAIIDLDQWLIDSSLIRANSVSTKYLSPNWGRLEWLQRGWVNACAHRSYLLSSKIAKSKADIMQVSCISSLQKYELIHQLAFILSNSTLSKSTQVSTAISKLKQAPTHQLARERIAIEDELLSTMQCDVSPVRRIVELAADIWKMLEVDAELSDWGRRQVTWDTSEKMISPVIIDYDNFPIENIQDARFYWEHMMGAYLIANRHQVLAPYDLPIAPA
jgi:hypothetical protein